MKPLFRPFQKSARLFGPGLDDCQTLLFGSCAQQPPQQDRRRQSHVFSNIRHRISLKHKNQPSLIRVKSRFSLGLHPLRQSLPVEGGLVHSCSIFCAPLFVLQTRASTSRCRPCPSFLAASCCCLGIDRPLSHHIYRFPVVSIFGFLD